MVAATIFGIWIVAVAFMAVFFVKICGDGSRIKVCEVLKLDTEPSAPPGAACQKVEAESLGSDVSYSATNVLRMPTSQTHERSKYGRTRKPA
ncbi:MAG TPA: hypothetical protein VFU86_17470 [Terriglobales bacterium]|nr:hypothetical protein [Terriglobales bacterium]